MDFAGGIVVHAIAGFAALASVLYIGKKKHRKQTQQHSFNSSGNGLLWFRLVWIQCRQRIGCQRSNRSCIFKYRRSCFFAAITWLVIEWNRARKPKFVGLLTGAVAGLATITPAAGYVSLPLCSDYRNNIRACLLSCSEFKNKMGWDDALMSGAFTVWVEYSGTILLGVFGINRSKSCRSKRIDFRWNRIFL